MLETLWEQLKQTSWIEAIAMISGLLFPIFAGLEKKICWLFGFISSVLYTYICIDIKLYQDAIISFYYVIMAIVGFLMWQGIITKKKSVFTVSTMNSQHIIWVVIIGLAYTGITGFLFFRFTDASFPFMDAFTTGFAFIATWLQARKKIENWVIFLIIDAVGIWLYYQKGLVLTSVLYIFYCILSVNGIIQWQKKVRLLK